MTTNLFKKAVKHETKLRLAIIGAAGSGKTYTALTLGEQLASHYGGLVAVVDTERGSASLYADRFEFDTMNMDPPYKADRIVEAIQAAEIAGYDVLVIDSLSHFWAGTGGILETVDQAAKTRYGGNSRYAWADGTPKQNKIMDAITGSSIHIIVTMRAKPKYAEQVVNGKTQYVKVGTEPIQRSGVDHEFDLVLSLTQDHVAQIDKGRFPELDGEIFDPPTGEIADQLVQLLSGAPPPPPPEPTEAEKQAGTWVDLMYELEGVEPFFETSGRLMDWVNGVTAGEFDPDRADDLRAALFVYCEAMAGGAKINDAFSQAKANYREIVL